MQSGVKQKVVAPDFRALITSLHGGYAIDLIIPIQILASNPANVISIEQQINLRKENEFNNNAIDIAKKILHREGIMGFFKGFFASCLIAKLQVLLQNRLFNLLTLRFLGYPKMIVAISLALSQILTYPLQVFHVRLIQQEGNERYSGIFDCYVKMNASEGSLSIWKGFLPFSMKLLINLISIFYDPITPFLVERLHPHLSLFAQLPTKFLLSSINFPFSAIQVYLQAYHHPKERKSNITIRKLWNGWFSSLVGEFLQTSILTLICYVFYKSQKPH